MSFTVTSQSVIRFGSSAKQEDEWKRTLMFFNVDISGRVRCDHRNEITASRTRVRNGKRELINEIGKASTDTNSNTFAERNPGGGLSNPIRESAMSFGVPNKFYAQSRDDFDHRISVQRQRSLGGRRNNPAYSDSRRYFHYRGVKPRRNRSAIASCSHFPPVDSTDRYGTPDYEAYKGYDEEYNTHFADESYRNGEYEEPNYRSVGLKYNDEAEQSRDCYKSEPIYESSHDYHTNERPNRRPKQVPYVPQPYRNYSPCYPEELYNDLNADYKESSTYLHRQASGSLPPEYASSYDHKNYCSNDYDYNKESGYDQRYEQNDYDYEGRYEGPQYPSGFDKQTRYSASKDFGYEDYGGKRLRPPPIPAPKPEPKFRKHNAMGYKTYKEKDYSVNQPRNYKTETDKFRDTDMSLKQRKKSYEPESLQKNIYKRHNQPEKLPPKKCCDHFKRIREAPEQYDRISKQILGLNSSKKYGNNFRAHEKLPRRASEKSKFQFYAEPEIPQPYKKYIKQEVPRKNYNQKSYDEIPRRQRNSLRAPSEYFGKTLPSKKYDQHERRSYRKSAPDKKKSIDFGAEIPYRIRRSTAASSVFFAIDIPYKRKERKKSFAYNGQYVPRRSDSGCDTGPQNPNSASKLVIEPSLGVSGIHPSFRPRTSLYDVENHRQRKTIRQKISGFFKKSKMCLKRSNIFKDKTKKCLTGNPCQRLINNPHEEYRDNGKTHSAISSPSNRCFLERNKERSILTQPNPTLESSLSRKGIGCHYPTVYRGKCTEIKKDETHEYSMYNVLGSINRSKCDPCDRALRSRTSEYSRPSARISSGNCSLCNSDNPTIEPNKPSEINVCLTIRGTEVSLTSSPRITSSKAIGSSESSNPSASRQVSGSSICGTFTSASRENRFKNVRFSPSPSIRKSSSSMSTSSRTLRAPSPRTTRTNTKSIEACSQPPRVTRSRSPEGCHSCPRHRIGPKWGLTRQCCYRQANQRTHHSWSPDKLESNCCRPLRPGLCLPNNIEMCSRPPTLIQCDLNKRSSLKGVSNSLERTSNKRVSLKTNSSSSGPSNACSGSCSKNSDKLHCCKGNGYTDIVDKPKCHNGRIDLGPRRTSSWPTQNPRSCPPRRSTSYPKVSNRSSGSTMSKCSRNSSQRTSRNSSENMQLVCLPETTCASCSTGPQSEHTNSFTALPYCDSAKSNARGDLCCPKLITDWEQESSCRKSIVEELKRELLQTFRTEQHIESQSHRLRPTPHIMIFPCVQNGICQPTPTMNSPPFCRPESVVCWAACSKPPTPF